MLKGLIRCTRKSWGIQ